MPQQSFSHLKLVNAAIINIFFCLLKDSKIRLAFLFVIISWTLLISSLAEITGAKVEGLEALDLDADFNPEEFDAQMAVCQK